MIINELILNELSIAQVSSGGQKNYINTRCAWVCELKHKRERLILRYPIRNTKLMDQCSRSISK